MILALLTGLLTAALAASPAPLKPYTPEGGTFQIDLPATWDIEQEIVLKVESPLEGPEDTYRDNLKIAAAPLAAGLTLDGYIGNSLTAYKAIWTVRNTTDVILAGVSAKRMRIRQKLGRLETELVKYFLAKDGRVYVITGQAAPKDFDRYLPTFEASVNTFRFVTPPGEHEE